jgi:hypothetical protein
MENILILPTKRKWFDMIINEEKKEEYRDIKPYYDRLIKYFDMTGVTTKLTSGVKKVCFRNGYSSNSPYCIAKCSLRKGKGKEKWGAEKGKTYYILDIHSIEVISIN